MKRARWVDLAAAAEGAPTWQAGPQGIVPVPFARPQRWLVH